MSIFYCVCDDDCRYETMTKEQILTAIQEAVAQGYVSDPDGAVISKIKEIRAGSAAQVWVGNEAQFNAISPAPFVGKSVVRVGENGVLYLCSDDRTLEDLENHVSDKTNPHNVTAEQVGAAAKSHTHKADDINGGLIPIVYGGTNAKTARAAECNISGSMPESANPIGDANQLVFKLTAPSAEAGAMVHKKASLMWDYIAGKLLTEYGFGGIVFSETEPEYAEGVIWLKPVE